MKKTNRFAMLALVGGVLASALVMGCGGGTEETGTDSTLANSAAGNGAGANSAPAAP